MIIFMVQLSRNFVNLQKYKLIWINVYFIKKILDKNKSDNFIVLIR